MEQIEHHEKDGQCEKPVLAPNFSSARAQECEVSTPCLSPPRMGYTFRLLCIPACPAWAIAADHVHKSALLT